MKGGKRSKQLQRQHQHDTENNSISSSISPPSLLVAHDSSTETIHPPSSSTAETAFPNFDTPAHSPVFHIQAILPKESWIQDLVLFVKSELNISDEASAALPEQDVVVDMRDTDYRTERILNLLKVPLKLELFSWFGIYKKVVLLDSSNTITILGYLVCLDAFLHLFTILPLKISIILFNLCKHYILVYLYRIPKRGGGLQQLTQQQKSDLLNGLLIIGSCFMLQNIDASRLYHSIRGQAIIKLYVIFNALEICDKLASAFGHDIMDSLHAYSPRLRTRFNRGIRFLLALSYVYGHTLVLFYQVMSLNVAINSYNNALLTLLISNQFVEIKGSVFKRFEKGNLFQLSCADSVERFQLSVFLLIVTIRNCLEIFGSGAVGDLSNAIMYYSLGFKDAIISLYHFDYTSASFVSLSSILSSIMRSNELKLAQIVLGPYIMVLGTEVIVDWVKHSFIVKFNGLKPNVYDRFMESICRDILGYKQDKAASGKEGENDDSSSPKQPPEIKHDRSPIVSKRIGFMSIPLACLVIRIGYQLLQIIGIIPETLISEARWSVDDGVSGGGVGATGSGPVEDESIGSWRLPLKLATWIKNQRSSFEKAGLSFGNLFSVSFLMPAIWILIFLLLVLFKFALGLLLLYLSRSYLLRKKEARTLHDPDQNPDPKLDAILNIHTPHHMLPRDVLRASNLNPPNISLDEIDRFSMVKSRIP